MVTLQAELAPRIAPVVLTNITTRYPYHDSQLFEEGTPPFDPARAHPAFCGSFDWHSSVHSHWTAIELVEHLRARSKGQIVTQLQDAVSTNLSAANLLAETTYLSGRPTYERPYGWAWALRLAARLETSNIRAFAASREPMRRLAEVIANNAVRWLRELPAPVRHGVHSNTAFALVLMHAASGALGFRELREMIGVRAKTWFQADRAYPQEWERSGNDFLSPGLCEADLMHALLTADRFATWWLDFVPGLDERSQIVQAVAVPKVSDGGIAHLHGLNLSRAGALARLATSKGSEHLLEWALALFEASVDEAIDGDYLSTHWLATFAWDAATSIDAARGGPAW
jgi:hypothetical protein